MEYVLINGEIIERPLATVDIEDRGYQFGDGVYEVIRVYNGKMFTATEHLERLHRSASQVSIQVPYSVKELEQMLKELLVKNDLTLGTVYMQVTRGAAPRNHVFPSADVTPTLVAYTKKVERPLVAKEKGVKAITLEDIRWLRCDIKSLNLLGNLLAKQKAAEAGCFEAIQHREQVVTEGSASNISIVVGGVVITHPANHLILNGISRQVMLKLCQSNEIPFEERAFTIAELLAADEVMISSTTVEIAPIIEIDGKSIGNGESGPVTKRLQQLFTATIQEQCGTIE